MTPLSHLPSPIHPALAGATGPSDQRIALRVAPEAERHLRRGHPWLYADAIRRQSRAGRPGDLAVVFDQRQRFVAIGLYDPASPIRVRMVQSGRPAPIGPAWFRMTLEQALQRRAPLAGDPLTTGYRLVHGENDGLPGLVMDRYEDTLVVKLYTAAWIAHLRVVLEQLTALVSVRRIVLRLARTVQRQPDHLAGLDDGMVLCGPPMKAPLLFKERGLRFEADPIHGQKTGFFLDQRENRAAVEHLTQGAAVLDAFAYTGAFSVAAARGGARQVLSVDASRPALEAARRNMTRNRWHPAVAAARHQLIAADAFEALERLGRRRTRVDVVIVDPPAFTNTRGEAPSALSAYRRLTRLALGVLRRGGTLMQSSCSAHVPADTFFEAVHQAARAVKRPLRELARTGHPIDHPVSFPEGAYLKCLIAAG